MPTIGLPEVFLVGFVALPFVLAVPVIATRAGGSWWIWGALGFFFNVFAFFGATCYLLAHDKGKNRNLWAVIGFFVPLIALIVLLTSPSEKPSAVKAPT